jgi:peptide/nickel transport system permease protein
MESVVHGGEGARHYRVLPYLGRRLLLLIIVALGVVTLTFLLMHITPGDPALTYLGNRATPQTLKALRHSWGLDRPLWRQYVDFIGGLFSGDLGSSLFYRIPNTELIAQRLPVTLMLLLMSTLFGVLIAVPLGLWSAVKKNGPVDEAIRAFNALALGMPSFWIGSMLILFLAVRAQIFPVGGYGESFPEHLHSLVLPALSVALMIVPTLVRSLRSSLIDALSSEYVAFGRSKGLGRFTVLMRYALRNGSISGVSILGINVGVLAGGSLVVENVFALPGMGSAMMQGILNRDFPVVQVSTLVFAAIVVLVYLLTDLAYALLDPRVRLA